VKEFKLPDLGEGIEAGDVVQVHVSEGDTVSAEQTVLEIETDKAVLEVPCPFAGKVTKVHVSQGDTVKVGATLLSVDVDGQEEKGKAQEKEEAPAEEETEEAPEEEAEEEAEAEPEPESKPKKEEKAEKDEKPKKKEQPKPSAEEGKPAEKEKPSEKPSPAPAATQIRPSAEDEPIPAGPATRRLARELGVDLRAVAGFHPDNRLTEEHVKAFVREGQAGGAGGTGGAGLNIPAPPLPDFSQWGPVYRTALSSLQRKTAEHLSVGWTAPHVTQFDEADITELDALRRRFRETERGKEVKLTVTAFVIKAVATVLQEYPQFNSSLDAERNELILKQYYHIGMAVDTPDGLIVPVIRDVDSKSVLELAMEMDELSERTRQRKITLDQLRGGTFTVTNLGGIGGTAFSPVLNHPEVAILGTARNRKVPVVKDGLLAERLVLPLCLSYDHRVVNGADGARFVRRLCGLLEAPEMLLLDM
jgi:pyruvate dehydrogenase E2 component (dihydrolipoamide acetyltransferase)